MASSLDFERESRGQLRLPDVSCNVPELLRGIPKPLGPHGDRTVGSCLGGCWGFGARGSTAEGVPIKDFSNPLTHAPQAI